MTEQFYYDIEEIKSAVPHDGQRKTMKRLAAKAGEEFVIPQLVFTKDAEKPQIIDIL